MFFSVDRILFVLGGIDFVCDQDGFWIRTRLYENHERNFYAIMVHKIVNLLSYRMSNQLHLSRTIRVNRQQKSINFILPLVKSNSILITVNYMVTKTVTIILCAVSANFILHISMRKLCSKGTACQRKNISKEL